MKTDRLTLLIAPADKGAIAARADALGISVSELMRRGALSYDPDDADMLARLKVLVPELHAAAREMRADIAEALAAGEERARSWPPATRGARR